MQCIMCILVYDRVSVDAKATRNAEVNHFEESDKKKKKKKNIKNKILTRQPEMRPFESD